MRTLLERSINSLDDRLVLLAPSGVIPSSFENIAYDSRRHKDLKDEMQRLRGRVYLQDGAISASQLTQQGLHQTPEDDRSWHLLTLDERQRITGCAWYLEHDSSVRPHHLRVRDCALAQIEEWAHRLWKSLEAELRRARQNYLRYAEVGGWAVSQERRATTEGLLLALAGYSLGGVTGGCLGLTTATVRHCSSSILRKLGGLPLEIGGMTVPSYYDPQYNCEMEILRFDSRMPSEKYADLVHLLREKMTSIPVIAPESCQAASLAFSSSVSPSASS